MSALASRGAVKSRARYVPTDGTQMTLDAEHGERVSLGRLGAEALDKNAPAFFLYSVGVNQTAIPAYAVGSALAGGKTFSPADVVECFTAAGKLSELAKAVDAAQKAIAKQAGGA